MHKKAFIIAILLIALGGGGYWWYANQTGAGERYKTPEEADAYVRFDMEAYDIILANFWKKSSDAELADLFRLSLAKAANINPDALALPTADREGTVKILAAAFAKTEGEQKKQLALDTLIVALYNLPPVGRSGLLSSGQVTDLRNEEKNIDPASNLYQDLGVQKSASADEVNDAFEEKKATLSASTSPQAKAALEQATYAHQVLADADSKARYDEAKVEPTVFDRVLRGGTLYLYVEKISPTTLAEFAASVLNASTTPALDSMIIDLRGNIGGTLDVAQYFLGLFLGANQYSFDLFHQDDYQAQRTAINALPELKRYREVAVITDGMTQSSAEVITAALKRFRLARVVGTPTRGWGTVENTFPLKTSIGTETYSLLLVHSITLRDDNQPIEGRGVDPDVNTSDPKWKKELSTYFRSRSLVDALSQEATQPPLR
ncbi:hypothetical protein A3F27_00115 [Candidatus Kaiserbacteria bacterium RIFCSPHIGHO2_12_FULL_53_13]|uniref:J domain-containing protein n=1 Tax=Candidatus Kaiserbacteria bacterium RIFCSPHIGHO2_12_FULL_53_13 TaxID=1798502 RepID=A0A1F6EC79_9BACT|nr:MAG: hypothetical protein A3F27_00115 [Candidatus Kaiserbacteria bacterium RIFCSPHIGHO2_12_FULL_53_13]OGG74298.1 MAG: hypothetical protein A3A37_03180 [Candidatus Kaiserbacteria bacterium RIFCSPLOWO2_01_FULL_52_36]